MLNLLHRTPPLMYCYNPVSLIFSSHSHPLLSSRSKACCAMDRNFFFQLVFGHLFVFNRGRLKGLSRRLRMAGLHWPRYRVASGTGWGGRSAERESEQPWDLLGWMKDKNKRERWEGKKREVEIWNIMTERCARNGKDGGLTEGKTCKTWVHVKGKGGRWYCFLEGWHMEMAKG